jgi:hypothetical protein
MVPEKAILQEHLPSITDAAVDTAPKFVGVPNNGRNHL